MKTFKVAFVGDSGVGKTSLIKAFLGEDVKSVRSTIGIDFFSIVKDSYNITVWDFAGQQWFREVLINMLRGAALVVMVFDLSRPKTLQNLIKYWAPQVKKFCGDRTVVIVVGNKKDIKKIDDDVIISAIDEIKKNINVKLYLQTSALLGENVSKLFDTIFELVKVTQI
ncbi:MAG: Rab family GTPase [Candidatus Njordarchaeales archaeon]